jgi:uncharacterized protein (TIGR03437 family)
MTRRHEYRWIWLVLLAPALAAPLSAQSPPEINALQNAASADTSVNAPPVGPGSLVSIFGSRFASEMPGTASTTVSVVTSDSIPLATSLGGASLSTVSVKFDGIAAPMLALIQTPDFDQVNAQIPWGVDVSDGQVHMTVTRDGQSMAEMDFAAADASPGIFTLQSGAGPAIVTNVAFAGGPADVINGSYAQSPGTICGALGNPAGCSVSEQAAPVGGVVTIWCNGLGAVDVPVDSGDVPSSVGPAGYAAVVKPVKALIGGVEAQVVGAALSPQFVGLNQVSVFVPDVAPGNSVKVQLEMEVMVGNQARTVTTRADATMSVRAAVPAVAAVVP